MAHDLSFLEQNNAFPTKIFFKAAENRQYVLDMSYKKLILVAAICTSIISCSENPDDLKKVDPIDPAVNLDVDDYKEYMLKQKEPIAKVEKKAPPIPKPSDSLTNPPAPKIGNNKTVTLSVTDDVPLKDVFIELARLADIDIEIDPAIEGGVIFKVKDKPLGEVIERLTSIAKLRYSVTNGVLRIEKDEPFIVNYPVNFLNLTRSGTGGVSISSNVLSGSGGSSTASDSVNTGSTSAIASSYDGDLWVSIEGGLKAIIGNGVDNFVNINRQGGQISVRANEKNHERVANYLKQIHDYYSSQVLIEAKVVEVELNDQFRSGVQWDNLNILGGIGIDGISTVLPGASSNDFPAPVATIDFSRDNGDLSAVIDLVQIFGATRTISSPRIMALNNQQSVFTFARNEVYFVIDIQEEATTDTTGTATNNVIIASVPHTIPIGIILSVQPSIDEKNNEVILNIRPTLSRTTGKFVEDPGFALQVASILANDTGGNLPDNFANISSSIPEVEVRELDTVLRLGNGQVMAIGGMIEQRANNIDSGVPFISEIPVFGNAFKSVEKETRAIQTVIFLKATIVPGYGVDDKDQEFYDKFTTDPRAFDFQ